MTIERLDEHTAVVSRGSADVGPGDLTTGDPVRTAAHKTSTLTGDPYALRRERPVRIQKGIYLVFGILAGLLGIRFVMGLLGAGPTAVFARFVQGITGPFIVPFEGLFKTSGLGNKAFEWNALAAILVYALVAWVLVRAVEVVMGDTRRGVHTTSSSHTDAE